MVNNANIITTTTAEIFRTITRSDIHTIFALIKEIVIAETDHF